MKNLAASFLNDKDKIKIRKAVEDVEKITSGEIVPMIVSSSYHYPVSNIAGGFTLGMIISLAVVFITGDQNLWFFLSIFMISFILMREVTKRVLPLKKFFISRNEINEEVEEAAITAFYKNGLYKTRDETGVLLFISVFEKKVWVLADRGINEKVDYSEWKHIVNYITEGIHEKNQGDAIASAVSRVGEILREHFPIKPDDTDELDNLIIDE